MQTLARAVILASLLAGCGGATPVAIETADAELPDVRGPWAERRDLLRVQVPLEDAPSRGAAQPLVTLVVFSDFECRYCRMFEPALERVVRDHPDDVRLVFRHLPLPFHEHAADAAEATEEARTQGGDEGFWALHDRLFTDGAGLTPRDLVAHAAAIGLDVERFRIAQRGHVHGDRIEDDLDLADRVGADGTPATYVNGRLLLGALPYEELAAIVDEEIALAREAMRRGIPRGAIYAAAMRESLERAPEPPPREAPPSRERPQLDRDVIYALPADGAPQLGPADAPVTIVVFSDFQCPFCARALAPLEALRERYPDRLRLVFRNNPLPFHRDAAPAAAAALEAFAQRGDAGFWAMHDLLFENQRALDRPSLERYAGQLGLDVARFSAALDAGTHDAAIASDVALAERLGARGTPIFYVNGRIVQGAQPLPVFVEAVEAALERADAERSRGTPAADVYRALMHEASPTAVWQDAEEPEVERADIPIPATAPRRGAREPTLVIQTFSDFQCPFCGRVQPTLARLLEAHPEVQLVFRHYPLPFHRDARPAAIAAIEVQRQLGDEGFWAFHDRLFQSHGGLDRDALLEHARAVGADPSRVARAIDEETHGAVVDADVLAVERAGLRIGTPAFLIGDRLLMGAQPLPAFEAAVREALDAQERL